MIFQLHRCFVRLGPASVGPHMGLEQALPDVIALDEDAWSTIEHLVLEPICADVVLHRLVLCPRLQPDRGDVQLLCLLEQVERHLSPQSQEKRRIKQ